MAQYIEIKNFGQLLLQSALKNSQIVQVASFIVTIVNGQHVGCDHNVIAKRTMNRIPLRFVPVESMKPILA